MWKLRADPTCESEKDLEPILSDDQLSIELIRNQQKHDDSTACFRSAVHFPNESCLCMVPQAKICRAICLHDVPKCQCLWRLEIVVINICGIVNVRTCAYMMVWANLLP